MRHASHHFRIATLLKLAGAAALAACADPVKPVRPSEVAPNRPAAVITYFDDYPSSGVPTSTGDTCPGYIVPSQIADPFWSGTDHARVQNPDSVVAADSLTKGDSTYNAAVAMIDAGSGAEFDAGPCEVLYNRCAAGCRRLRSRQDRALCWAGCMARLAKCRADEAARRYFTPPTQCPAMYDTQMIYDPGDPAYSTGDCGSGGGEGGPSGNGGEGGGSCVTEWVTIEINDGNGWRTYWEGYAIVCG